MIDIYFECSGSTHPGGRPAKWNHPLHYTPHTLVYPQGCLLVCVLVVEESETRCVGKLWQGPWSTHVQQPPRTSMLHGKSPYACFVGGLFVCTVLPPTLLFQLVAVWPVTSLWFHFSLSPLPQQTLLKHIHFLHTSGRSGHGARRNTRPTALFISTDSLTWGVFASVIVSALERRRNAAEVKVVLRVSVSARTNDLRGREHFVLLAWLSCMLGVSI